MTDENEVVPKDWTSLTIVVISYKCVDDGLKYEFSAGIDVDSFNLYEQARDLIWNDMTPAQQKKMQVGSAKLSTCLSPAERDPRIRPMMPSDFFALIDEWKADPSSFNLDAREEYSQHNLVLRVYQERQEAMREVELAPVRDKARRLLEKRACNLGVSVDAMAIIEAMQQEFAKLHDRLNQIQ
nr:hypothetical protein [uncultured Comamonas sp.]